MKHEAENPYLRMNLERVRQDALHGVSAARTAWRQRDPDGAGRALGYVAHPGGQAGKLKMEQLK